MIAGLIGLVGISLYLTLGYLCSARFLDSWLTPVFYILLGAPIALFVYWIVRLVLAIRHKNRLSLIFLGIDIALVLAAIVFLSKERPLIYRVQADQTALEQAALSAPQGISKTPKTIGSFVIRETTRKDSVVWFECWDAMFSIEGLVYSASPNIPERQGLPCRYEQLTGNWYLWREDHFQ